MKGLREPTEEESRYIKKHITSGERVAVAVFVFGIVVILTGIAFMIKTLISKGSVPFAIFSIALQLGLLFVAYIFVKLIKDTLKKMKTVKDGEFRITECKIVDVTVQTHYKRSSARISVVTTDGKKYTFTSANTYGPSCKKGRHAYIAEIGSGEDSDRALIPTKKTADL